MKGKLQLEDEGNHFSCSPLPTNNSHDKHLNQALWEGKIVKFLQCSQKHKTCQNLSKETLLVLLVSGGLKRNISYASVLSIFYNFTYRNFMRNWRILHVKIAIPYMHEIC